MLEKEKPKQKLQVQLYCVRKRVNDLYKDISGADLNLKSSGLLDISQ